jgi:ethanolamine utilization protein EutN
VQLARIIGDVVATIKDQNLEGHRLLVLQPVTPDASRQPAGRTLVAVDSTGSGVGEYVFFVRGREASFPFLPAAPPVDACVIGTIDHCDVEPAPPSPPPAARRL